MCSFLPHSVGLTHPPVWRLMPGRSHWTTFPAHFKFLNKVALSCLGWNWTCSPPVSVPRSAGIKDMRPCAMLVFVFFWSSGYGHLQLLHLTVELTPYRCIMSLLSLVVLFLLISTMRQHRHPVFPLGNVCMIHLLSPFAFNIIACSYV